jgi:hypothetical protein
VASVGIEPLVATLVDQPRSPAADRAHGELGIDGKEGGRADGRTESAPSPVLLLPTA